MEVKGTIIVKNNLEQVTPKFKKQTIVVETEGDYPQFLTIEFVQDKVDLLNNWNVNQKVKVSVNLTGRKWEKEGSVKYFNSIQGWKVEDISAVSVEQHLQYGVEQDVPF